MEEIRKETNNNKDGLDKFFDNVIKPVLDEARKRDPFEALAIMVGIDKLIDDLVGDHDFTSYDEERCSGCSEEYKCKAQYTAHTQLTKAAEEGVDKLVNVCISHGYVIRYNSKSSKDGLRYWVSLTIYNNDVIYLLTPEIAHDLIDHGVMTLQA